MPEFSASGTHRILRFSAFRCFVVLAVTLAGCGLKPGRHADEATQWGGRSRYTSSDESWLYLNSYTEFEEFDRYLGYGMVHYGRDSSRDGKLSDEFLLTDALRLCREQFHKAYSTRGITRLIQVKSGSVQVPFEPKYIAVVVTDKQNPKREVGIVVPAEQLFSKRPLSEVSALGKICHGDLYYADVTEEEQQNGWSPGKQLRYAHVDEHIRELTNSQAP